MNNKKQIILYKETMFIHMCKSVKAGLIFIFILASPFKVDVLGFYKVNFYKLYEKMQNSRYSLVKDSDAFQMMVYLFWKKSKLIRK